MATVPRIALGAPGIYRYPVETQPVLGGVRMDVCAFVGVAPRGPSREPIEPETWFGEYALVDPAVPRRRSVAVPVASWDEYKRLYGGFEGPGRLPYAVASFFEQGGRKAYIARIVHDYGDAATNAGAVASGELTNASVSSGSLTLAGRNEGSWGNRLRAGLGFSVTPIGLLDGSGTAELMIATEDALAVGSLLRLTLSDGGGATKRVLRFVASVRPQGTDDARDRMLVVTLDSALDDLPEYAEMIEGDLLVDDGADTSERFKRLGLSAKHPRWMATVLYNESELVYPEHAWIDADIEPLDPDVPPLAPILTDTFFSGGEDRYAGIVFEDFFDRNSTFCKELEPGEGVCALKHLSDLSSVVVPDLYVPESLPEQADVSDESSLAGASFEPCVDLVAVSEASVSAGHELEGLLLNPGLPDELDTITALQKRLVEVADTLRKFVVLLDVPPGLSQRQILRWRAHFHSSYAAAYYPWLKVANLDDQRDVLIRINPSAAAAGIIAKQELLFGVPQGPANVIASGVVKVDERISPMRHDELHPQGINIYLQERDGVRLHAARTLSRDSRYRQLSVRRLMLMLQRALERQMQWAVFEPNGPSLWADVRHMIASYLRRLYTAGAFKGRTEAEAFFVRCDAELNDRRITDAGRMLAEIGVAPAEPLEFIVVRMTRGGDGTLTVES